MSGPGKPPTLSVNGLEVRYGGVPAVRGLSLDVHHGEVVGLIGPNGAGKTTALFAIMGVLEAAAGEIAFEGSPIAHLAPERVSRLGLAMVPEGRRIFGEFTVEENIRLGMMGRSSETAGEDLEWVFSLFPIVEEFRKRTAGQLSGGQQQQLAIARALVSRPKLLLLDEPTLGLAPVIVDSLFDALAQVRERGVSILLVEQRAQLAIEFADRTIVMRDGERVAALDSGEAVDPEELTNAYFGS